MITPVPINDGQVSGVDDLGSAPSSVVNWEADEAGINRPRPPLNTHTVTGLPASAVIGTTWWNGYLIIVTADRYIYTIADALPTVAIARSTSTTTTQVEGSQTRVTFAHGASYVYIAGGGRIQRWGPSIVTAERLTSSPYCTHVAAIGNYLVANDLDATDRFRWSDIGEGAWSTWPAANFTVPDARPDPVVSVFENANELYIFGDETCQVYALGSDPTLPFETVSTTNTGIGASYAAARLDERFAFMDDKRRIVVGDGRSVQVISDAIQKTLRDLTTVSDCWMYREERGQHSYVVARFPTEARTFAYHLKAQRWHELKKYTAPFQGDFPVSSYTYWPRHNYHMFGTTSASGGLYRYGTGQELSSPLVCERVTGWQDFGTGDRKQSNEIRIVMRRGTAAQGATPGALEVRRQCDDGPWSEWQQVSVGVPSDYAQVKRVFMRRIFRRCRYHLRFSTTEDTSIVSLSDDITPLMDSAEAVA